MVISRATVTRNITVMTAASDNVVLCLTCWTVSTAVAVVTVVIGTVVSILFIVIVNVCIFILQHGLQLASGF